MGLRKHTEAVYSGELTICGHPASIKPEAAVCVASLTRSSRDGKTAEWIEIKCSEATLTLRLHEWDSLTELVEKLRTAT
jgi:hypothetical protein